MAQERHVILNEVKDLLFAKAKLCFGNGETDSSAPPQNDQNNY